MKASKTLTTTLAAAALVGAIGLAYAQSAEAPAGTTGMPLAEQVQPQMQATDPAVTPADMQAPQATDAQPATAPQPAAAPQPSQAMPTEPAATPIDATPTPATTQSYEPSPASGLTERAPRADRN